MKVLVTGGSGYLGKLRDKSVDERRARERDLREQLFKLRFQRATGRVENPMKMREVRREIAQIQTLLNERTRTAANA